MLKYLYTKVVFQEVPNEVSLGISISNCPIKCKGCNQKDLWEDKGNPLNWSSLNSLIHINSGISCVCFFGGESDLKALCKLMQHVKKLDLKVAWYTGLDRLPEADSTLWEVLDYIKIGHYDENLGGLDNPNTNQKLFKIIHSKELNGIRLRNITAKLHKPNITE